MCYYCLAYLCSSVLGRLPFYWLDKIDAFFDDLDVLAILIGLSVYAICCIILIHSCFLKCDGHSSCTPCFLLGVSVLTCDLQDTIFNCLIIVLHCIKDPSLFVHYLNLFNLFNCIELLTSYATSLFWCAFVASILKVTYFFTSLKEANAYFRQQSVFSLPSISLWIISAPRCSRHAVVWYFDRYTNVSVAKPVVCLPFNGWTVKKCSWFNGSQVKWYVYRSDDADTRSRSRMQLSALMLIIPAPGRVLSSANN